MEHRAKVQCSRFDKLYRVDCTNNHAVRRNTVPDQAATPVLRRGINRVDLLPGALLSACCQSTPRLLWLRTDTAREGGLASVVVVPTTRAHRRLGEGFPG